MAGNLAREELEDQFSPALRIWVREEELPDGRKLTEVFNETHENPKCVKAVSHSTVAVNLGQIDDARCRFSTFTLYVY